MTRSDRFAIVAVFAAVVWAGYGVWLFVRTFIS